MTQAEADAIALRTIAERAATRGEDGIAALVFFTAELLDACVSLPVDLVDDVVTSIKAEREGDPA